MERAKKLKPAVDQQTEPLLKSSLRLDESATPVIERFDTAHRESLTILQAMLRPWLPDAGIDWGQVAEVAVGLSTLLIPATGFAAVAVELTSALIGEVAGNEISEAQAAVQAAENGMMMANWFSGLREVGDAAQKSKSIVRQNYQTATKLQLAVLIPWNDMIQAYARGDQAGIINSAVRFVAIAPTYIREAERSSTATRELVVSFLIADLFNSPAEEARRQMAVALPAVLKDLRNRKGFLGGQGADARLQFIEKTLAHVFDEVKPDALAVRSQSRHSIAELYPDRWSLYRRVGGTPARPGARPTLEYHGTPVSRFGGDTFDQIHDLAQARLGMSLLSVSDAVKRKDGWVMEPSIIVTYSRPPSRDRAVAIALATAARRAEEAREYWGRIAGVVP